MALNLSLCTSRNPKCIAHIMGWGVVIIGIFHLTSNSVLTLPCFIYITLEMSNEMYETVQTEFSVNLKNYVSIKVHVTDIILIDLSWNGTISWVPFVIDEVSRYTARS